MTFYKNHFPATFGGHLEFMHEMLKTLILETVCDRAISTIYFCPTAVFALVKNECETHCLPSFEKARQL